MSKFIFHNCLYTLESEQHKVNHLISLRSEKTIFPFTVFDDDGEYYEIRKPDSRIEEFTDHLIKKPM